MEALLQRYHSCSSLFGGLKVVCQSNYELVVYASQPFVLQFFPLGSYFRVYIQVFFWVKILLSPRVYSRLTLFGGSDTNSRLFMALIMKTTNNNKSRERKPTTNTKDNYLRGSALSLHTQAVT